jgi:hypothetical protein
MEVSLKREDNKEGVLAIVDLDEKQTATSSLQSARERAEENFCDVHRGLA